MQAKIEKIYGLLDQGLYRDAVTLCLARDVQGIDMVKSLLVFAYASMRKKEEALQVARALIAKRPVDDSVLAPLSQSMKMLRHDHEMIPCYEHLLTLFPTTASYMEELFFSYVRQGDAKKMQLMAQKLYKTTGKASYVFWSVCSMMQQPAAPPTILVLAERMLHKVIHEGTRTDAAAAVAAGGEAAAGSNSIQQPGAEELQLYVDVLVRQGKYAEALAALTSLTVDPTATATAASGAVSVRLPPPLHDEKSLVEHPNSIIAPAQDLPAKMLRISVLQKSIRGEGQGQGTEAAMEIRALYEDVLRGYPDQWDAHAAVVASIVEAPGQTLQQAEDAAVAHQGFLRVLQQGSAGAGADGAAPPPRVRGPYLAEIALLDAVAQLRKRRGEGGDELPAGWALSTDATVPASAASSQAPSTATIFGPRPASTVLVLEKLLLLCQYLVLFGDRQCVVSDLMPYLLSLAASDASEPATSTSAHSLLLPRFLQWADAAASGALERLRGISLLPEPAKPKGSKNSAKKTFDPNSTPGDEPQSEAEVTNHKLRAQAAALTCFFAKLKQIQYILCSTSNSCKHRPTRNTDVPVTLASEASEWVVQHPPANPLSPTPDQAVVEFYRHSLSLTLGGIGGEREVQTGDEVLALLTAAYQDRQATLTAPLPSTLNSYHWAGVVALGQSTSPWNFLFHLQRVETCRLLSDAKAAIEAFNKLRVKQVQVESMSYLLLPVLYEYGYFLEAGAHCKSIISFHASVQYDAGDQIGKSFSYSNYMKGMEIFRFIQLCKNSIQLALAKIELAHLEIVENCAGSADSMLQYLMAYEGGRMPESQPLLTIPDNVLTASEATPTAVTPLHDRNFDYNIVTRLDVQSLNCGAARGASQFDRDACAATERRTRHSQMLTRVQVGQLQLRVLMNSLVACSAMGAEDGSQRQLALAQLGQLSALVAAKATDAVENATVRWNQKIDCGGSEFEALLHSSFAAAVQFALSCQQHYAAASPSAENNTLTAAAAELTRCTSALTDALLNDPHKRLLAAECPAVAQGAQPAPLAPQHIRRVAAFMRSVGTWVPALLTMLLQNSPKLGALFPNTASGAGGGKKKGKAKGKEQPAPSVPDGPLDAAVKEALLGFGGFYAAMYESLKKDAATFNIAPRGAAGGKNSANSTSGDSVLECFKLYAEQCHGGAVAGWSTGAEARAVCDSIVQSQYTTCLRSKQYAIELLTPLNKAMGLKTAP